MILNLISYYLKNLRCYLLLFLLPIKACFPAHVVLTIKTAITWGRRQFLVQDPGNLRPIDPSFPPRMNSEDLTSFPKLDVSKRLQHQGVLKAGTDQTCAHTNLSNYTISGFIAAAATSSSGSQLLHHLVAAGDTACRPNYHQHHQHVHQEKLA